MIDQRRVLTACPARSGGSGIRLQGTVDKNLACHTVSKVRSSYISHRTLRRIEAVAATVVLALLLFYFLGPADSPSDSNAVMAGSGPKIVSGHVYDSLLSPVPGADVTVRIKYDGTERKNMTTSTDLSGFYTVTFDMNYWMLGDTIQVDVTYDSLSATNSAIATALPAQTVDVHFSEVIPEFGGLLVAVVSVFPFLVAFAHRYRGDKRA